LSWLTRQTTEAGFTAASYLEALTARAAEVDALLQRLGQRIREAGALVGGARDDLLAEADAVLK
jgi:hypothetical protein